MKLRVRPFMGFLMISVAAGCASGQVAPAGPPVLLTQLGNSELEWRVPVSPAEFSDCVAEVAQAWDNPFDVYNGQSWVSEGQSWPWGWEQECYLFPPGVIGLEALEPPPGIDVWVHDAAASQFVWSQSDEAGFGRGLIVNNAGRHFAMLGAGKAPPPVFHELTPYLDQVINLALSVVQAYGPDGVPGDCSSGYGVGSGRAVAPAVAFRCSVAADASDEFPESVSLMLTVTLEDGMTFTYP